MSRRPQQILITCTIACLTVGLPAASANAQAADKKVNSEITLDVTGGPHAGHYVAKVTEAGCSDMGNSWGNQYSIDAKGPNQFSSLQLIVPDAKSAAKGASKFKMTVTFGPLFGNGTNYDIDTGVGSNQTGTGTLKIADRGSSATVSFDGKTVGGVGLKGTIECHSVLRMN